jgi:hypothetical protein
MSPQISLVIPTLPPGLFNGDHYLLRIRGVCICHFSKLQGGGGMQFFLYLTTQNSKSTSLDRKLCIMNKINNHLSPIPSIYVITE